jgi:hypothetical protein
LSDEERRKRKTIGQTVRFEYCKVKTNEGNWVLHVIFRGGVYSARVALENLGGLAWSEDCVH